MRFPYKAGDWLAICDQCGRQAYASQLIKRWDNLMVHSDSSEGCFETRHPQDFVRAVPDSPPLPWTRPGGADSEIEVSYIAAATGAAYAQIPEGTFDNTLDSDQSTPIDTDDDGGIIVE